MLDDYLHPDVIDAILARLNFSIDAHAELGHRLLWVAGWVGCLRAWQAREAEGK